ncbi:MAG: hypothetical protein ACJATT_003254 [Myxococcota bacterium]|jgi:hypothetical protein
MASVRGEYWATGRWGVDAGFGVQRRTDGTLDSRDATLHAVYRAVAKPTAVVTVRAGLSIPTGGVGSAFTFTPLSTASVDPRLSVNAALGATWLVLPSVSARLPVYRGWDGRLQGPFLRADLRGARRFGAVVPWLGLSASEQMEGSHPTLTPPMRELAATGGATIGVGNKWGINAQIRAPLVVGGMATKVWSAAISVRYVLRREPKDEH